MQHPPPPLCKKPRSVARPPMAMEHVVPRGLGGGLACPTLHRPTLAHTGVPLFFPQGGIQQATTLHAKITPPERPHTHNKRHGRPITQMGVKAHGVRPLRANNLDATPCEPWWSIPGAILIQVYNQGGMGRPQGSSSHVGRPKIIGVGVSASHWAEVAHVHLGPIFLCLPRAERNQRFLFVKNESMKFFCSRGYSNVPDVVEDSVLFISCIFHVRSVSCRCLYLGFRAPSAARVTRVTCSKRSILGVPLEAE